MLAPGGLRKLLILVSSSASASAVPLPPPAAPSEQSESPAAPSASAEVSTSVNPQYAAFCASYKTFYDSANKADTTPRPLPPNSRPSRVRPGGTEGRPGQRQDLAGCRE